VESLWRRRGDSAQPSLRDGVSLRLPFRQPYYFQERRALPALIPWESDFAPDDANQITGDVGGNLVNQVGVAQTLSLAAAVKTTAGMVSATGIIGRGVGLRISGSVGTAPTAAEGAMLVGWAADRAANPQNSLFLSIGSALGANEWALYKQVDGVSDLVGGYAATPGAGDTFIISHTKQGAISVAINGVERITGNVRNFARNRVWGLTWTGSESVGTFAGHPARDDKFVIEAL
jgi:hypothetical protein